MRDTKRPYVICHMLPSIDGRIVTRGWINGSFLAANLIDELSILVAPIADGSVGTPSLFDVADRRAHARRLKLVSAEKRSGEIVWLRYEVR